MRKYMQAAGSVLLAGALYAGAAGPVAHAAVLEKSAAYKPYPAGIVSFGNAMNSNSKYVGSLCNEPVGRCVLAPDGRLQPLGADTVPVLSDSIEGIAYIRSMSVSGEYSSSKLKVEWPAQSASLQLNGQFFVRNGSTWYFYWIQDMAVFDTSSHALYFIDDAWTEGSSDPSRPGMAYEYNSMSGKNGGKFPASKGTYYYIHGTIIPLTYSLPMKLSLLEKIAAGTINFQYGIGASAPVTFDRLSIDMPHTGEGFFTSGKSGRARYDFGRVYTAFVFAGPGGGGVSAFSSMDTAIGMYYGTEKGMMPYTEVQSASIAGYTRAYSTGESVTDLQSSRRGDGSIVVAIGNPAMSWYSYGTSVDAMKKLLRQGGS